MLKTKSYIKEISSLLDDLFQAKVNIKIVASEIKELDTSYQKRELNYDEYLKQKNRILSNRVWEDVWQAYVTYVGSIKQKIKQINAKALKNIYDDKSEESLIIGKIAKIARESPGLPALESLEIGEVDIEKINIEIKPKPGQKAEVREIYQETPAEAASDIAIPLPGELSYQSKPLPGSLNFWKRLMFAFQAKQKPWLDKAKGNVSFEGYFSREFFEYLFSGKEKRKSQDIFGLTKVMPSILSYENMAQLDDELGISKTDILDPYLLEKQIKELKSIISRKKPEVYKASTLGYLANISVRKIGIYFIEKYPGFFKRLYTSVRYSNIKILANTYINIMFFLTIISGLVSLPVSTLFFAFQGEAPGLVFLKSVGATITIMSITFWLAFYYPFMKAKSRKRSINTNLPFAIDHMSSVISSGVSPATMFKLISNSKEYGEISVEMERVISYVDFFGYDILTSLKAVAMTTPSEEFKEFLDGFVSTIETGGDLKAYLSQKSSEALLNYRLERQKYVESLSTYSDIYTGVLIAAPLFFVTALSLVSALGGTIGGMKVDMMMTMGTYVAIPALNVVFLIFLEISQPDI